MLTEAIHEHGSHTSPVCHGDVDEIATTDLDAPAAE